MSEKRELGTTEANSNQLYERFVQLKRPTPDQPSEKLVTLRPVLPKGGGNLPPSFPLLPHHSNRDNPSRVSCTDWQPIGNVDKYFAQGEGQFDMPLAVLNTSSGQAHELVALATLGVNANAYLKELGYE